METEVKTVGDRGTQFWLRPCLFIKGMIERFLSPLWQNCQRYLGLCSSLWITRTLIDTLLCQILGSAASLILFANLTMSLGLYRFVFIPSDFHSHLAQHAVRPRDSSKRFATITRLDRCLIREQDQHSGTVRKWKNFALLWCLRPKMWRA